MQVAGVVEGVHLILPEMVDQVAVVPVRHLEQFQEFQELTPLERVEVAAAEAAAKDLVVLVEVVLLLFVINRQVVELHMQLEVK